ncbi:hypothetical protein B7G55_21280 [Aeromonas hydrophila]|uniref:ABC-three component system protein n=1 Tax=Aeromonas hydrophila TaxID=644 RepID=UPI000A1E0E2C|nr:ABC-three component system protein [Aeromonas hydrophila]OSP49239.1 hypothetical protein B7G55_21280 [Aeromonas hydrophila]
MKYAYDTIGPDQFEKLIVCLCQHILGISTIGFSKGPDGGQDAKFIGKAALFPSVQNPWNGSVVIQAKHTIKNNGSCSESDFFSTTNKSCVILKELPKIKRMKDEGNLDYYMLFANRRLSGLTSNDIVSHISSNCGIPLENIYLGGIEQLEMLLKKYPQIADEADIDPIDSPLFVTSDELAEVVEALARHLPDVPTLDDAPVPRVLYETKNKLNNMTDSYAIELRKRHLKQVPEIQAFLSDPENSTFLAKYEATVDDFQFRILSKRHEHHTFDEIIEYLHRFLVERDPVLGAARRLTRTMLFYMYWNCDIGETKNAETD